MNFQHRNERDDKKMSYVDVFTNDGKTLKLWDTDNQRDIERVDYEWFWCKTIFDSKDPENPKFDCIGEPESWVKKEPNEWSCKEFIAYSNEFENCPYRNLLFEKENLDDWINSFCNKKH